MHGKSLKHRGCAVCWNDHRNNTWWALLFMHKLIVNQSFGSTANVGVQTYFVHS